MPKATGHLFHVEHYDLAGTLNSGQAFRWRWEHESWTSVVGDAWVRLRQAPGGIAAETAEGNTGWGWLADYLQVRADLDSILATFPKDEPLQQAVRACRGLRLLRQDPWECLASFILSSTKQIVQIRQIISSLCGCFGNRIATPPGFAEMATFPSAQRLAGLAETELRACKMGFRAPYLLKTACQIAAGKVRLEQLRQCSLEEARVRLIELPGVGRKIADCVLLFAYGFEQAFPLDVWVMKALRQLYFHGKKVSVKTLQEFAATHFGPQAGYAQQYLFHYMRTKAAAGPGNSSKT